MDKILKLKLLLIATYFFLVIIYFYDEHFYPNLTLYYYGNIQFMVATICFGIIISATIYNIALYIFLKNLQHLYYALAQSFTLFFLINLDSLFISPFDKIFQLKSILLFDYSQLLMLFFSLLFLKNFFQTYALKSTDIIINFILALIVFDFICSLFISSTFIFKFIPIFIPIILILSEAYREIEKTDLPFNLIIFGWSIVLVVVTAEYLGALKLLNIAFPFFHIAVALESIILAIAIAYKVKLISDEKEKQQMMLLQQSRLASVGEMISNIAHQWRQPLNILSFGLMNIKKSLKNETDLRVIKRLNQQLQYMSQTIEDFRNFYKPSKIKINFDVHKAIKKACHISSGTLDEHNINLKIIVKENFTLYGKANELEQVLLTLIQNAKDAFILQEIIDPIISITIDKNFIYIQDNAGGIPQQIIEKIFIPYFSTKIDTDGIGLHLAKVIIEQEMKGEILVQSTNEKTLFTLAFQTTTPI